MSLVRAVQSFSRLREIVNILFKEGFEEIIEELRFKAHLPFEKRIKKGGKKPRKPVAIEVRLRRAMEEAGGAFVKLGQMLSLRSDLIPQHYCEEFAKLQDQVKPFEYSKVKKIVEKELGKPLNKLFKDFEKEPIASASVSQVHKAQLHSGQWVVIKVQRPHLQKKFKSDIDILHYLAEQAEKYSSEIKAFKPKRIVQEFEDYTRKELDFFQEGKNVDRFANRYAHHPHIKIPKVYWELTSKKVLTLTYIKGKKISEAKGLTEEQRKKITLLVYRSFIEQVFNMRTFHADPHPGNILIQDNGKVAFLDFGIVGRISPDLAESVEMMLIGLVKGDLDLLAESFMTVGAVGGDIDQKQFKEDLFNTWGPYHNTELDKIDMGAFLKASFKLARKYQISYPGNFVLLIKAVITTEAFGKKLYGKANFVKVCSPQVEKLLREQQKPSNIWHEIKKSGYRISRGVRRFPEDLRTLMYVLKNGAKVHVDVDNADLKRFTREIDHSSNRVTLGVIIGSLIIGAGLLTLSEAGPVLAGVSIFAWIAIGISIMLSIALTISIITEHRGED